MVAAFPAEIQAAPNRFSARKRDRIKVENDFPAWERWKIPQSGIISGGSAIVRWPLSILCWSRDFAGKPDATFPDRALSRHSLVAQRMPA
jgi:hypothetical protein